jgi:hypothetical protein
MNDDRFEKILICVVIGVALWAVVALNILMVLVLRKEW